MLVRLWHEEDTLSKINKQPKCVHVCSSVCACGHLHTLTLVNTSPFMSASSPKWGEQKERMDHTDKECLRVHLPPSVTAIAFISPTETTTEEEWDASLEHDWWLPPKGKFQTPTNFMLRWISLCPSLYHLVSIFLQFAFVDIILFSFFYFTTILRASKPLSMSTNKIVIQLLCHRFFCLSRFCQ